MGWWHAPLFCYSPLVPWVQLYLVVVELVSCWQFWYKLSPQIACYCPAGWWNKKKRDIPQYILSSLLLHCFIAPRPAKDASTYINTDTECPKSLKIVIIERLLFRQSYLKLDIRHKSNSSPFLKCKLIVTLILCVKHFLSFSPPRCRFALSAISWHYKLLATMAGRLECSLEWVMIK